MKQYSIYLAAATLLLLAACAKDPSGGEPGSGLQMRLAPSVEGAATKAGETTFTRGTADLDEFWFQLTAADPAWSYYGRVSKGADGSWSAEAPLSWQDESAQVEISAAWLAAHDPQEDYDFSQPEFTDGKDIDLPLGQNVLESLKMADLLYLPATTVKYTDTDGGRLSVALRHALARLNVVITLGEAFYDRGFTNRENSPVANLTIAGAKVLTRYHFTPATGAISPIAGTAGPISPYPVSYTPATSDAKRATAVYELVLVPATFEPGELSVTFQVGEGTYEWINNAAITLASGQTANLPVSVSTEPPRGYVDMGNGLKWATCNVGAAYPWDYGDYFAWGETAPKAEYKVDWSNYFDTTDGGSTFTKYNLSGGKTVLDPEDDAATVNWGGPWRMPTAEEWTTLCNTTLYDWTPQTDYLGSGKNGILVTRKDGPCAGNSIFLPEAGSIADTKLVASGEAIYWSSSLSSANDCARIATSGLSFLLGALRNYGRSVRPVFE
jgi:hypothetical protein